MSQTIETRFPAATGPVTIPDPSDTLGDPVVEQTMRKLIETAGRLVANRNAPGVAALRRRISGGQDRPKEDNRRSSGSRNNCATGPRGRIRRRATAVI